MEPTNDYRSPTPDLLTRNCLESPCSEFNDEKGELWTVESDIDTKMVPYLAKEVSVSTEPQEVFMSVRVSPRLCMQTSL